MDLGWWEVLETISNGYIDTILVIFLSMRHNTNTHNLKEDGFTLAHIFRPYWAGSKREMPWWRGMQDSYSRHGSPEASREEKRWNEDTLFQVMLPVTDSSDQPQPPESTLSYGSHQRMKAMMSMCSPLSNKSSSRHTRLLTVTLEMYNICCTHICTSFLSWQFSDIYFISSSELIHLETQVSTVWPLCMQGSPESTPPRLHLGHRPIVKSDGSVVGRETLGEGPPPSGQALRCCQQRKAPHRSKVRTACTGSTFGHPWNWLSRLSSWRQQLERNPRTQNMC